MTDDKISIFELYDKQEHYITDKKISRTKSIIAGVLLFVSGGAALYVGVLLLIFGFVYMESIGFGFILYAIMQLVIAGPIIIGGIFCVKRKRHTFVMFTGIVSIFTLVIPGLIALLLIFMSEDEFIS